MFYDLTFFIFGVKKSGLTFYVAKVLGKPTLLKANPHSCEYLLILVELKFLISTTSA